MPNRVHSVLPRGHRNSRSGVAIAPATASDRRGSREVSAPYPDNDGVFSIVAQIKRFRKPMSVSDLAPLLGVSEDALYRMVRNADIPQLIVPGRRVTRFDPATIVFWLTKHNPVLNQVQKAS